MIPALLGTGAGLGLLLGWWGLRGTRVLPHLPPRARQAVPGRVAARVLAATLVAAGTVAATGWPVAAVATFALVVAWPSLFGRDDREAHVRRLEAIAVWTESIRDTLGAAAGLRQAVLVAAEQAPEPIAAELAEFRRRTERDGFVVGLDSLGRDLADPVGDLVVAALVNATHLPSGDLGLLLGRLAESIRDDVRMHRRIHVSRQRITTSSRIVCVCMAMTFAVLAIGGGDLLEPYTSTAGQIWLALVVVVVGAGLIGLRRMAALEAPVRFVRRTT